MSLTGCNQMTRRGDRAMYVAELVILAPCGLVALTVLTAAVRPSAARSISQVLASLADVFSVMIPLTGRRLPMTMTDENMRLDPPVPTEITSTEAP